MIVLLRNTEKNKIEIESTNDLYDVMYFKLLKHYVPIGKVPIKNCSQLLEKMMIDTSTSSNFQQNEENGKIDTFRFEREDDLSVMFQIQK